MVKKNIKLGMFLYMLAVIVLAIFPATGYEPLPTLLAILPLGVLLGGFWYAVDYADVPLFKD